MHSLESIGCECKYRRFIFRANFLGARDICSYQSY